MSALSRHIYDTMNHPTPPIHDNNISIHCNSGTPEERIEIAPSITILENHLMYQSIVFLGVTDSNIWS